MVVLGLISIAILIFGIVSMIMPWLNRSRLGECEREITRLKQIIAQLQKGEKIETPLAPVEEKPALVVMPAVSDPTAWTLPAPSKPKAAKSKAKIQISAVSDEPWFENLVHHLSTRFPVWIGGVAIALAGFFMVKYSIENELLSPSVRVLLGGIFACALLAVAHKIRDRSELNYNLRIAQALSGAGVAILYVVSFASSELYHLVPPIAGFAAMTVTTALAVILSVRHGMPIALLGMLGGFLTPAVMSSDHPSAATLFIYLYAIYTGLMVVIQRERWWVLSIPTLLGAFLWVIIWLASGQSAANDTVWIGLFLIGVSMSMVMTTRNEEEEAGQKGLLPAWNHRSVTNYLGLAGALTLMGVTAHESGFQLMDWVLYGVLAAGAVGLAIFQPRRYALVPMAAMAISMVMLVGWSTDDDSFYVLILVVFAVLFIGSGYAMLFRAWKPLPWALQTSFALVGYYLLAYFNLHEVWHIEGFPYLWGAIGLVLAAALSYLIERIHDSGQFEEPLKKWMLAIFLVAGTSLVSSALAIEIRGEFLSLAFAAEILALCWIQHHLRLSIMPVLVAIMLGIFGFLLLPQLILLAELSSYSLLEMRLHIQDDLPIVNWPLLQLGVPAILLALASVVLRQVADGKVVKALELSVVPLIAIMGYYLMRHALYEQADVLFKKASFIERSFMTHIFFAFGVACLWVARRYGREAVALGGGVLCALALFRIAYFDLILYNPYYSSEEVGEQLLFNGLLLTYLAPLLWLYVLAKEAIRRNWNMVAKGLKGTMLILAFCWVSFTVAHVFHGSVLSVGEFTAAENYTYSLVWLLFGLALVFFGVWKKDKAMHHASLAMILLVAGKVFLVDAAELEGLYRVFSFLGLGVSLIGISYFFSRFVYHSKDKT